MIALLLLIPVSIWLLWETDFMRVRLFYGKRVIIALPDVTSLVMAMINIFIGVSLFPVINHIVEFDALLDCILPSWYRRHIQKIRKQVKDDSWLPESSFMRLLLIKTFTNGLSELVSDQKTLGCSK